MIILFDLDGTVIDSTEPIITSFQHAFLTRLNEPPAREKILSQIGHPLDMMFENLNVPKDRVWDFVATYKEKYREISFAGTFLLDGVKNAIEEASEFATLGVVTTKTSKYSTELLEYLEVMHYFKVLIGREDVVNPKPHPEPILKAIEALDPTHDKSKIWMIGDTLMDVESAKAAGINHVAVTTGYAPEAVLDICSDYCVDSLIDAVALIKAKV
jgi:phosphoglycolate phosphatase